MKHEKQYVNWYFKRKPTVNQLVNQHSSSLKQCNIHSSVPFYKIVTQIRKAMKRHVRKIPISMATRL